MAQGETFNQLVNQAIAIAEQARDACAAERELRGAEARDLSLAITHLEDARTRYNSSRYRLANAYDVRDPDDPINGLFGGIHGVSR